MILKQRGRSFGKRIVSKCLHAWSMGFDSGCDGNYGWSGNYLDWESAVKSSSGYGSSNIFEKTLSAARVVRDGKAAFERDSFVFHQQDYNWPLLSCLMYAASAAQGRLHVVDVGGALGSTYFQNQIFLKSLPDVVWCIVEQSQYVIVGKREFEDGHLRFCATFEEAVSSTEPTVLLSSAFLAYIQHPYEWLSRMRTLSIPFLVFDRTGFTLDDTTQLTVQRVPPWIYEASYPCWFLSRSRFFDCLSPRYGLMTEFICPDKANIPSEFRGFLFKSQQAK